MSRLSVRGVVSDGREGTDAEKATCTGWGETVGGWPGPQAAYNRPPDPGQPSSEPGLQSRDCPGCTDGLREKPLHGSGRLHGKTIPRRLFQVGAHLGTVYKVGEPWGGAHRRQHREDWVGRGTDEEQEQAAAGMTLELPRTECPVTGAAFGGLYLRDIPRCAAQGD